LALELLAMLLLLLLLLLQIGESSAAGAERETYEEAHARYVVRWQLPCVCLHHLNTPAANTRPASVNVLTQAPCCCVCRVQVLSQYAHWDIPVIGQVSKRSQSNVQQQQQQHKKKLHWQ
jgi:hypothetical protein